jgi:hypothetical protein
LPQQIKQEFTITGSHAGFEALGWEGGLSGRKCHDSARFVAHFRRTRCLRSKHHQSERELGYIMSEMTLETAVKNSRSGNNDRQTGDAMALDRSYREIGISAVAAAARYQGSSKNPAYAPAPSK